MTRAVPCDAVTDPAQAEAAVPPLDQVLPGVPGRACYTFGPPEASEALTEAAAAAGATVIRGVGDVDLD